MNLKTAQLMQNGPVVVVLSKDDGVARVGGDQEFFMSSC
jgi:hypothetical protein